MLLALLVAYILIGSAARAPWPDEGAWFGAMWTLAHGSSPDWWFPNVAGARDTVDGPMPSWLGAAAIHAFGPSIGDAWAARIPNLAWFGVATSALWYGVLRLARREEAQPVTLAFGGHAEARDYGRMLADIALLLLLGTLGVALRLHEITADATLVALGSLAFYGTSIALDSPWRGGIACGLANAGLALTLGPLPALGMLGGCCVALRSSARGADAGGSPSFESFDGTRPVAAPRRAGASAWIAVAVAVAAALLALAWPIAATTLHPKAAASFFSPWPEAWGTPPAAVGREDFSWIARNSAWYLWPLWPLAAWALYAWHAVRPAPHIARPAWLIVGILAGAGCCAPVGEPALATCVAPLAALAAFGATTLRRGAENLMDWLTIVLFTLAVLFVWAYFIAMTSGFPPRMAASIAHLAPGWRDDPGAGWIVLAVAASVAWLALAGWRSARSTPALWRGALLAAAGATMLWSVMVALFMPAFEYTQSHRDIAREIARHVPWRAGFEAPGDCLQAHRIPLPIRGLIAFESGLRFGRGDDGEACVLALQRISGTTLLDEDPPPGHPGSWRPLWDGHRAARPAETWRLWQRVDPGTRPTRAQPGHGAAPAGKTVSGPTDR
ncbi:MAG TPA: hypothetical protein VMU33_13390 [Burkholderiaceae bacterium]|nr:hypothetical protein [Burkholderiaceae bacterium]